MKRWLTMLALTACSGGASTDTDGGSTIDGAIEAAADAGSTDAHPDASQPLPDGCAPAPLPGNFPPPLVPANRVPGACTTAQISGPQGLVASCGGNGTAAACQAFHDNSNNAGCISCLATEDPKSATSWGPLLHQNQHLSFDYGACIALRDPGQLDCAKTAEAAMQCIWAACAATCPISFDDPTSTQASIEAYNKCYDEVNGGECQLYINDAFGCEASIPSSSPAYGCFSSETLVLSEGSGGGDDSAMKNVATIFCGP